MATTSTKNLPQAETPKPDVSNQENVTARSNPHKAASKSQVRHRASVACASCRDRRIRCVVPKGEIECTQCKRTDTECIIKNDDERRRYAERVLTTPTLVTNTNSLSHKANL